MHLHFPRLNLRISRTAFFFAALSLANFAWANAYAFTNETHAYKCSDGRTYAVWVDPEPLGGLTPEGVRLQFRAFCSTSATSILECLKDETPESQACLTEFKEAGNLSEYLGSQVILAGKIRHAPSSSAFTRRLPASLKIKKLSIMNARK